MSLKALISDIHSLANPARAKISERFFKTGKGQYGEGDVFLGLTVPQTRTLVKKYMKDAPLGKGRSDKFTPSNEEGKASGGAGKKNKIGGLCLDNVDTLLANKYHEVRLAGCLVLVYFAQKKIYPIEELARFYMQHVSGINNWDLIDGTSEHIIGPFIQNSLSHEERVDFITQCIASSNLWINRIIILASFYQIKQGNGKLTIYIAERMLTHKHDLIHKAVGWMLREVGKRCSMDELRGFLDQYADKMPRTMLRYAIEKMDKKEREFFLKKK